MNAKIAPNVTLSTPLPSSLHRNEKPESPPFENRFNFVVGYPPTNPDEKSPLCILNPKPFELEEMVIEDASLETKNFLVCSSDYNLFRFISTLRSAHLSHNEIVLILVLCSRLPTDEEFARLRYFSKLSFMVGDYRQT